MKKQNFNLIKIFPAIVLVILFSRSTKVLADPLQNKSDTMSRLGNSSSDAVLSDHEIQFTTPTGVASTQSIEITFPSDFDGLNDPQGALDYTDVDLLIDNTPDGTCDGIDQTLVASGAGVSEWNAVFSDTENRVLTLTSGGASAVIGIGDEVCIKIGENATGGTANSQYINPTSSAAYTISIATTSDSGNISVSIIDNDIVVITADITETISFAIDDYTVGFGNLTLATARFATGSSPYGSNPPSVPAHHMTVATNGSTGYEITYLGATLTNQNNDTIDPATIVGDEDGTPDTEQFAIGFTTNGNASIAAAYNQVSPNFNYSTWQIFRG